MQTLLYVMAILGCGESDAACREVRIEQQTWRSEASCRAATPAALMRHSDLEYPTVVARCRPADARPQLLRQRRAAAGAAQRGRPALRG